MSLIANMLYVCFGFVSLSVCPYFLRVRYEHNWWALKISAIQSVGRTYLLNI